VGEGKYDFTEADRLMISLLNSNPKALAVPRVMVSAPIGGSTSTPTRPCVSPTAPGASQRMGGTKHESFASDLWKMEGGEALRQFVRHVRNSTYSDSVIGIHVANGIYGEWHLWSATDIPDISEPMRQTLIHQLKAR